MIKDKIRHIKLYRDQIKLIKKINYQGKYHFESSCLVVKDGLDCSDNQLTSLPDNLVVNGNLNCHNNQLTRLPDNLVVKGNLYCGYNKVKLKLPTNVKIGGNFYA